MHNSINETERFNTCRLEEERIDDLESDVARPGEKEVYFIDIDI